MGMRFDRQPVSVWMAHFQSLSAVLCQEGDETVIGVRCSPVAVQMIGLGDGGISQQTQKNSRIGEIVVKHRRFLSESPRKVRHELAGQPFQSLIIGLYSRSELYSEAPGPLVGSKTALPQRVCEGSTGCMTMKDSE